MKQLFLFLSFILGTSIVYSQTFKVTKISGKKAIVEINDSKLVEVGETYKVGSRDSKNSGPISFKRDYGINSNFSLSNGNNTTIVLINGNFLWNMKTFEVGPELTIINSSGGGSSVSSTEIGAIGYYNFVENKPGVSGIPSAIGAIGFRSSGSSSVNISLGGNYRWFVLSGDHGFSFSALYNMQQSGGNSNSNFSINGGIVTYF